MTNIPVISGENFIRWSKYTDLAPDFVRQIDPTGYNLISQELMHNDALEMRLVMLFKLVNQEEPLYGTVTIRTSILNKIKEYYMNEEEDIN